MRPKIGENKAATLAERYGLRGDRDLRTAAGSHYRPAWGPAGSYGSITDPLSGWWILPTPGLQRTVHQLVVEHGVGSIPPRKTPARCVAVGSETRMTPFPKVLLLAALGGSQAPQWGKHAASGRTVMHPEGLRGNGAGVSQGWRLQSGMAAEAADYWCDAGDTGPA